MFCRHKTNENEKAKAKEKYKVNPSQRITKAFVNGVWGGIRFACSLKSVISKNTRLIYIFPVPLFL